MRRPERLREDDGRVLADMDLLSGLDPSGRREAPEGTGKPPLPPMTKAELRRFTLSAMLAALTVALVLSLAVVALVLFCQFVWFR
jgi:hypothetical protein